MTASSAAIATETNPLAVEQGACGNSQELGGNHCAVLHKKLSLAPGEEVRLIFMLGAGPRSTGREMRRKYSNFGAVDLAFADLHSYWQEKLAVFECRTPHPGLDTMINTWTLYQAETCVVWSRFASFIEVGGRTGLGYRDTAQDVMSVVHTNPGKCRQRLLELLHGQVSQGYALHLFDPDWFDPERQKRPKFKSPTVTPAPDRKSMIHGLADVCSDDALWMVVAVCEYVKETGEIGSVRSGGALCRRRGGDGIRSSAARARFLGRPDRRERHLQGPARRLERLPEFGRRRERHGLLHAPLGLARIRRRRHGSWGAMMMRENIVSSPRK